MPSGKGFADLVFIPRPNHAELPAMVVELKKNKSAEAAIDQIKKREYVKSLEGYTGTVLLVGISYNPDSATEGYKEHHCVIEQLEL